MPGIQKEHKVYATKAINELRQKVLNRIYLTLARMTIISALCEQILADLNIRSGYLPENRGTEFSLLIPIKE